MLANLYGLSCTDALKYTQAFHDSRRYPQNVRSPQTAIQRTQVSLKPASCLGVPSFLSPCALCIYMCPCQLVCQHAHTHTSAMHKRQHCHTHRHTACQTELFAIAKPLCITKHQALWTALVTVVDRKFGPQTKSQAGLVSCLEP